MRGPASGGHLAALPRRRRGLPRGEGRITRTPAAVEGSAVEVRLPLPSWFERGEDPRGPVPTRKGLCTARFGALVGTHAKGFSA